MEFVAFWNVPVVQTAHAPSEAGVPGTRYWPASQSAMAKAAHAVALDPASAWNVPAGQGVQALSVDGDPAVKNWPAGHPAAAVKLVQFSATLNVSG